ncbi:MAG: aminodeoxychorismate/anthranilate synthase component II [Acidobacteria bacterium]|nr:MAG: aminodeoxychorismate/anthranilate synthase component II [Acidobacteriota bacterium]PYV41136.1 MAG: aminodeoxychorismate/anthranilate synthase component II [Acidobacteriota bacterium]
MILVIDNYDSFTFNLAQYLGELGQDLKVFRNDAITVDEIAGLKPERIVISPGPGRPENSGIIVETIQKLAGKIPILGVCLGHQAIGAAFGGEVVRAPSIMHGKTSRIYHDGETIFRGVENPFTATRYHSLVVSPASLPGCLEVSARTEDGVIMGLRHRVYPVEGVQFHPESILTTVGKSLLANFLSAARAPGGLTIDDCRI